MAWPRSQQDPWYSNYGMLVATAGVLTTGLAYMLLWKPYERGNAPAGDASRLTTAPAVAPDLQTLHPPTGSA
jgi:hypothetical protein